MKYFALATLAASASAFSSYEEYVAGEAKPVCEKHLNHARGNRLCNLFMSCHGPEGGNVFDHGGVTGSRHCPLACARFSECFPRQMCGEDYAHQNIAHKFRLDEDNNQVCYTRHHSVGERCVSVQGFCDIGAPAPDPAEQIALAGAAPCDNEGCVGITLMWSNEGDVRNDLDIYVDGPQGRIYYGRRSVGAGYLDTDAGQGTRNAVENIAWTENAPRGHYSVFVDNYSQSGSGVKDFTVAIRTDGGAYQTFEGSATGSRGNFNYIYSFDY